jgi:hypothetical protein
MVQQNVTQRPINFLLPEFMIHWPYERRLNTDFGTVDVDSANWVNEHRLFSAKAQKSFKASLTGERHHRDTRLTNLIPRKAFWDASCFQRLAKVSPHV